jgi:putative protease
MDGKKIGEVTHYYDRINVAVIKLSHALKLGDQVHFLGYGSDFLQEITSMELDHKKIKSAAKNQEIALKVTKPVKNHTIVYLITE